MSHSKPQFSLAKNPPHQQHSGIQELLLWQEYCQQLQSVAGTLSDNYWVSQGLSMLKINDQEPGQSKTKQALRLLNSHNSKLELINKIIKNLSLCSTIDYNQQKLVVQVMNATKEWEKWVRSKVSQTYIDHDGFLGNADYDNEDQPEKMETFEVEFDDRRIREFEKGYNNHEEKDVEI